MHTPLEGICPIIATPFTDGGAVDYDGMRRLIAALIEGGCHALTLFGIAGEYYKLTEEEERRMAALTIEECRRGGVPSIVSVTRHATAVAVEAARRFEDAGADCLMLLPPFFLKPSASQVCDHALAAAHAVRLPIMFQYAPEQTGVAIAPEALARLQQQASNLCIFKIECRPPGGYISRLLEITGGAARVFIGNAGFQLIEGLDRGAAGCMPGCSMFDVYLEIYRAHRAGDRARAFDLHERLLSVLNHIRQDVEMIIAFEKEILLRRGLIASAYCRKPTYVPDPHAARLFDELFARIQPLLSFTPSGRTPTGN
jgi:4-hydroxy-tetrahydrodipicolinate synthase